jgi:hypothetical protein
MISTSVEQIKLKLSRIHDLLGNQKMTKDDFVEWAQTMTMNPSTAWDLYCQMYPAQERKVMNLAQTTRLKKRSQEKDTGQHRRRLLLLLEIQISD